MKAALYCRVSTDRQETELQIRELREYCTRQNWDCSLYQDEGISGRKDSTHRPGLARLLDDARRRRFDLVLVWKIDRFARNARVLLTYVEQLTAWGVDFVSLTQPIDTRDPISGKLVLTILAAVAEMEVEQIRERVRAGLRNARANGVRLGNAPTIDREPILRLHAAGKSNRQIARELGISHQTANRVVRAIVPGPDCPLPVSAPESSGSDSGECPAPATLVAAGPQ